MNMIESLKQARWIAAAAIVAAAATLLRAEETTVRVIVHPSNAVTSMTKVEVAQIFLKKATKWPNGQTIQPVELSDASVVRPRFAQEILGRTTAALNAYWQQQIFAGRDVPPLTKSLEGEVIAFVRANPNAIGYVSADTPVGDLKTVAVK